MKIFINENTLSLTDKKSESTKIINYTNKKELLKYITDLENNNCNNIELYTKNIDTLIDDYKSLYKIIYAAGGIVINEKDEILFIKRLGKWDLPKGKIEKGETNNKAAVREVTEETGVTNLNVINLLQNSYHTYNINEKRILKHTYWYIMKASGKQNLVPQTIEDITEVKWINVNNLDVVLNNSYNSIKDLCENFKSIFQIQTKSNKIY